jgi:hypothetical protein
MAEPLALGRISSHLPAFEGAFLLCADCRAVHRIARSDRAPLFRSDGGSSSVDDFRAFLDAHADHRFRLLRRTGDAEMISHARWDPMCRIVWEVTDGESDYVVTFGRTDLDREREYAIFPGHLVLDAETVAVDAQVFRRLVDEAMFPHVAPERKIDALLERCCELVSATPSDGFEPIDEMRDDPNVQLACVPAAIAEELRAEALRLFSPEEATRLVEVIDNDLRRYIPVVRISRRYRVASVTNVWPDPEPPR